VFRIRLPIPRVNVVKRRHVNPARSIRKATRTASKAGKSSGRRRTK
jgi:hypothetical protein